MVYSYLMVYLLEQFPLRLVTKVKVVSKCTHDGNRVLTLVNPDLLGVLPIKFYVQNTNWLLISECALVLIIETDFSWVDVLRGIGHFLLSG